MEMNFPRMSSSCRVTASPVMRLAAFSKLRQSRPLRRMRERRNNNGHAGTYDPGAVAKHMPQPVGDFLHAEQTADGCGENDGRGKFATAEEPCHKEQKGQRDQTSLRLRSSSSASSIAKPMGTNPGADDPVEIRRQRAEHRLQGDRDKKTEKRRPAKSSAQDVGYPYQHPGGKKRREQVVKSDAEFPGQWINEIKNRKGKSLQSEVAGVNAPLKLTTVNQIRMFEIVSLGVVVFPPG